MATVKQLKNDLHASKMREQFYLDTLAKYVVEIKELRQKLDQLLVEIEKTRVKNA